MSIHVLYLHIKEQITLHASIPVELSKHTWLCHYNSPIAAALAAALAHVRHVVVFWHVQIQEANLDIHCHVVVAMSSIVYVVQCHNIIVAMSWLDIQLVYSTYSE